MKEVNTSLFTDDMSWYIENLQWPTIKLWNEYQTNTSQEDTRLQGTIYKNQLDIYTLATSNIKGNKKFHIQLNIKIKQELI